jgi:hypothetical protein
MRGLHGRHGGSGEAATINDAIRGRSARLHREKVSSGASARRVPQDSAGHADRLNREREGSGRLARVKD